MAVVHPPNLAYDQAFFIGLLTTWNQKEPVKMTGLVVNTGFFLWMQAALFSFLGWSDLCCGILCCTILFGSVQRRTLG